MSAEAIIRHATSDDAEAMARLADQLGYPTTTDQARQRLASIRARGEHAVFVAEKEGAVIGWVHVLVHPSLVTDSAAEIAGLVVDQEHRSRGVGQRLMQEAEQWAAANGCRSVRLRSNVVRARAHAFYQRLGYTVWKSSHNFRKEFK